MHHNVETATFEDFDDLLPSPSISASSLVSECSETKSTLSPVSDLINEEKTSEDDDKQTISADDDKQPDVPQHTNDGTYDYLPQDYTLTELDLCAHLVVEDSSEEEILVKIDQAYVKQCDLICLLHSAKWLNDYVINAYIYSGLLKQDGEIGIHEATFMTKIVGDYLKHDNMIHLPINIKHTHWYLACVNIEKSEIQVLDSLCWEHNRVDLTNMLQGLQYHLDILKTQENLSNHNWKDLDVTKRTINEQLHNPIQKDSLDDENHPSPLNLLSIEKRYQSLISVVSNMSIHELEGGLCNYIKSISSAETLEKVWVQSSDPNPISLTLKRLQGMVNEKLPMERDCFNLVVRKIMFDDIHTVKKRKGLISKHCLDTRFWIHIPIQSNSGFILFVLAKDTRTVYILDPTPIDPNYQRNPYAKYVPRLLWIAEHLSKAMSQACPRSTWNENIFLWHQ
ncbi:hypothetical protein BRADI_1g24421v3 [Brachypodium distachyon]|uniref:Ubiquitin-like protease family profile domain-containing protein n=1 Tax=Brachypodium distachyon TaxID=15368 RepID=A0A0Q3NEH2_BRADI|nr:hypothetical protein BRADI_1g24421v3 [Brachypodium distachyon]